MFSCRVQPISGSSSPSSPCSPSFRTLFRPSVSFSPSPDQRIQLVIAELPPESPESPSMTKAAAGFENVLNQLVRAGVSYSPGNGTTSVTRSGTCEEIKERLSELDNTSVKNQLIQALNAAACSPDASQSPPTPTL